MSAAIGLKKSELARGALKTARSSGFGNSVIDNGLAGILPCGAVAWTARALLAGCALAGYVKAYSASNKAARGAVGAYQRRGGAV